MVIKEFLKSLKEGLQDDDQLKNHATVLLYEDTDVVTKVIEALRKQDSIVITLRVSTLTQRGYTYSSTEGQEGNVECEALLEIACSEQIETNRLKQGAMTSIEAAERIIKVLGTSKYLAFQNMNQRFSQTGILTTTVYFKSILNI